LDHQIHEIEMEVLALEIPDTLVLRISDMKIGDAKHLSDLELPPSAKIDLPADAVIVQVNEPMEIPDEVAGDEFAPTEPELVGKKDEDGDDED
jgi:large subunit ribosomal protein L25